jgi:hypothetical protein
MVIKYSGNVMGLVETFLNYWACKLICITLLIIIIIRHCLTGKKTAFVHFDNAGMSHRTRTQTHFIHKSRGHTQAMRRMRQTSQSLGGVDRNAFITNYPIVMLKEQSEEYIKIVKFFEYNSFRKYNCYLEPGRRQ